jgi:hypothetical protein
LPAAISPGASLTGLTYLYQAVMAKAPQGYLDLGANCYLRRPIPKQIDTASWTAEEQKKTAEIRQLLAERAKRQGGTAEDQAGEAKFWQEFDARLSDLLKTHPKAGFLLQLRAGQRMREGKPDEALKLLSQACDSGWWNATAISGDPVWEPLAAREEFKAILTRMKSPDFTVPPAKAFLGAAGWDATGQAVAPDKGRRYLLSAMLAVTTGRGTTKEEALAYLARSAAADGTSPKGTIYLMRSGDVRSAPREWAFGSAAQALKRLGVGVAITDGVLPRGKADVAGLLTGAADFVWDTADSKILPGAFCENLTSFGGILAQNASQTPLTEFLRRGAAASSGTVAKPYALQEKFPTACVQVFYASGCNLGEAFYQSVSSPYQILLVGDPLCQPWAKAPTVAPLPAAFGKPLTGRVAFKPSAAAPAGKTIGRFEAFLNGRRFAIVKPNEELSLDTTKVPDGTHELRIVAVMDDPVQAQGRIVMPIVVANTKK